MQRSPRRPNQPLLSGKLLWRILIISIVNLIAVFGIFEWVWQTTGTIDLARTMAVHTLVAAETFYLLSISRIRGLNPKYTKASRVSASYVQFVEHEPKPFIAIKVDGNINRESLD